MKEINKINNIIEKYKSTEKKKLNLFDIFNNMLDEIKNLGNILKDFNINLKNPIHILNNHTSNVWCLTCMKDGRLASSSGDNSIIIYNKITYKPDLIIKEHNDQVYYIIQLSSGILASGSCDNKIKLFK